MTHFLSTARQLARKSAPRERSQLPSPLRGGSTRNARRGGGGEDFFSSPTIFSLRPPPLPLPTRGRGKEKIGIRMPTWRNKPPNGHNFNKRARRWPTPHSSRRLGSMPTCWSSGQYAGARNASGTGAAPARSWPACAAICRLWPSTIMKRPAHGWCSAAERISHPPITSNGQCGARRPRCGSGDLWISRPSPPLPRGGGEERARREHDRSRILECKASNAVTYD
jgi:hypothetical protein